MTVGSEMLMQDETYDSRGHRKSKFPGLDQTIRAIDKHLGVINSIVCTLRRYLQIHGLNTTLGISSF
jgi:hypothetical protein